MPAMHEFVEILLQYSKSCHCHYQQLNAGPFRHQALGPSQRGEATGLPGLWALSVSMGSALKLC